MSDTEEVVLTRAKREKVNTKPEIAREKLKEKRERLKKEKENLIIEEAKKRLAEDSKKAEQEALIAKQKEEEQKQKDPSYAMLKRMEEMMMMFQSKASAAEVDNSKQVEQPQSVKRRPSKKKVEIPEPEPEEEEKPKRKPRQPKQVVDKPNKSPGLPKPRKKVVYLQQDPVPEESTQFVGYDIAPPAEPIQYSSSSGLLSALMGRRNMNTVYY